MGKDPAFLFYPGDWLGGTMTFSRQEKGAYIDLLMAQFNIGHMTLAEIKRVLGNDFDSMWKNKLKAKFRTDRNGKYYNAKLETERTKRKKFTESRKKNLKGNKNINKKKSADCGNGLSHMGSHMENENVIEDVILIDDVNEDESKENKPVSKKIPPSKDEIVIRCMEMNYPDHQIQAERFYDYYESNGWKVGKNKMRNWHSALANWYKNLNNWNSEKNLINNNGRQHSYRKHSKAEQSIRSGLEAIELLRRAAE